jgi:hypothetical protein
MTRISKSTKRSRLQAAGWVYVEGWLPMRNGQWLDVWADIAQFAEEAERIANTPQPMGRPRKEPSVDRGPAR